MILKRKFLPLLLSCFIFLAAFASLAAFENSKNTSFDKAGSFKNTNTPTSFETSKQGSLKGILQPTVKVNESTVTNFPNFNKNKRHTFASKINSTVLSVLLYSHYSNQLASGLSIINIFLFYSNLRI